MSDNLLEIVRLDDVLAQFSLWGRYHAVSLLSLIIMLSCDAMTFSNFVFIAEKVRYKCANNISNHYDVNKSFDLSHEWDKSSDWCNAELPCTQWIYEKPDSFVAEFQLACQEWKRTLVGTAHISGYMVGISIIGSLSDRFGRRTVAIMTGSTNILCGFVKSFVNIYWVYIAIEFVEGAFADSYSPLYMLILEMVSTGSRPNYTSASNIGLVLGGILLPLIKWLIADRRTYTRVIYAPLLFFIPLCFLIDESPRWLLNKGKNDKVVKNIKKAAKLNKIEITENLSMLSHEKDESSDFTTLITMTLKSKTLMKRFFICIIWWNTCTLVDNGLMLNSVLLKGNKYLNYGMVSTMRLPAAFLAALILNKYRRKGPLIMAFIGCSLLCACQPFMPKNQLWLGIAIYMASKIVSGVFINITYIFTSELFPTCTRNSMQALCSCLGRFGNLISTQIPLLEVYWSGLPIIIYSVATLVAALLTLLVPDTGDAPLPDTVRQAEALDSSEIKSLSNEGCNRQRKSIGSVGLD